MYPHALLTFVWIVLFFPFFTFGASINAGFVEGLWYAKEPVFADIDTRIYVAFRNTTEQDVSGTIRFEDNNTRIGSVEVHALSGRIVEAWVDWKPSYGTHTLTATLTGAKVHAIGKSPEAFESNNLLIEETLMIDRDTDNDGIGNETDTDDDNDTVSDSDERERGSDPLVSNPILKESKDTKEDVESKNDPTEVKKAETTPTQKSRQGLEAYTGEGTVGNLFSNVTQKTERAKASLDTYREERNTELYAPKETSIASGENTSSSTEFATITRTKIDTHTSLLQSFIDGVRSIFQSIWTFILFILSNALAYPALIQILLLVAILYICYRLMRRVGRRSID